VIRPDTIGSVLVALGSSTAGCQLVFEVAPLTAAKAAGKLLLTKLSKMPGKFKLPGIFLF